MGGERSAGGPVPWACLGSSPHARGTPSTSAASRSSFRFIPAYAGNARRPADAIADHPVHPRMRGERFVAVTGCVAILGSSPHARGTLDGMGQAGFLIRFIPACAGNALDTGLWLTSWTVHPRMRGERIYTSTMIIPIDGSSPHARGTPATPHRSAPGPRFIPACAGNAGNVLVRIRDIAVHPRMRGERRRATFRRWRMIGSSPHARGTLTGKTLRLLCCRFIPACAGNARRRTPARPAVPVHPRMRGERSHSARPTAAAVGSSPHARGTRLACSSQGSG